MMIVLSTQKVTRKEILIYCGKGNKESRLKIVNLFCEPLHKAGYAVVESQKLSYFKGRIIGITKSTRKQGHVPGWIQLTLEKPIR